MAFKIKILFIGVFLFTSLSFSQVAVEVIDRTEDMVGRVLVYRVKEKFRESNAFVLLTAPEGARIRIIISSMDRFKGSELLENISTMYSVIWLLYDDKKMIFPIYLDHTLGFAGRSAVEEAAEGIVANTDKVTSSMVEIIKFLEKLLNPRMK
ncbi:MAG: hypothetical protein RMJ81_10000 [Candidatus Kryptonium sp.]|nr:hypothetical protein [Candidatus Kryptonium sp.]MCX7761263.1 hypothetical protein [Candidatus Kryptonium sp.]MDW8109967.1 hypothetical protein [Candidatus Kryptonium sp.]